MAAKWHALFDIPCRLDLGSVEKKEQIYKIYALLKLKTKYILKKYGTNEQIHF